MEPSYLWDSNSPILSIARINSQTIVSGNASGIINIWDVEQMTLLRQLMPPSGSIHSCWDIKVAILADGTLLSTGEVGIINLWDINSGELKKSIEHVPTSFDTITILSTGQLAITYSVGMLKLYE